MSDVEFPKLVEDYQDALFRFTLPPGVEIFEESQVAQ